MNSNCENERTIAMARKQREKDPRPRPQPPRTSQARHVAGIIVGPGSVVPGPLELSLSRDRSRTLHRSGSRRSRIGRSVHMKPHRRAWRGVRYDAYLLHTCAVNCRERQSRERTRPVFHVLWVLAGIKTVNLSRATCFVIVLIPAVIVLFPVIFKCHVFIPARNEII